MVIREYTNYNVEEIQYRTLTAEEVNLDLFANFDRKQETGGYAVGAFCSGQLKGFMSMEPALFGSKNQYMDMSNIYVSCDMRHRGIGKNLFQYAKARAKEHGAR